MAELKLTDDFVEHCECGAGQLEVYDSSFSAPGSFGLRIGAGGRKSFFLIVRLRGKRKRITLGHWPMMDVDSARHLAYEFVGQAASGRDPAAEQRRYRRLPSFQAVASRYFDEYARTNCRLSTQREYARIIERELLPLWADVCIADISSQDVNQLLVDCALERGRLALANRVRAVLSGIMRYAQQLGYIQSNPVSSTERIREEPKAREGVSFEELIRVWGYLSKHHDRHSCALKILVLTGQRLQDVLRMRWREIQVDMWMPAGDSHRPIHLHSLGLAALRELRQAGNDDFVFADSSKIPPRDLRKSCRAIAEECRISQLNPSAIRQTVLSEFTRLGARPEVIAYISGRTTILKQFPQHASEQQLYNETQKIFAKWVRKLSGAKDPEPTTGAKIIPLFGV